MRHIPVDKRLAYAEAAMRRKRSAFPEGKSAVRLRLIGERGNVCEATGLIGGSASPNAGDVREECRQGLHER